MTEANIEAPSTKQVPSTIHNGLTAEAQVEMAKRSQSRNTGLKPSFDLEFDSDSLYRISSRGHDGMSASQPKAAARPESAADARQKAADQAVLRKELGLPANATEARLDAKLKANWASGRW